MSTAMFVSESRTKAARRALILDVAPRVLRRTGLQGFGLQEVAREAGWARQTIYNYFEGRDDLLAALLVREMMDRHAPITSELGSREPSVDAFVDILVAELEAGKQYELYEDMLSPTTGPRMAELIFSARPVMEAREQAWLPILKRYADAGVLRDGLDHREVVRWLTWQSFWILCHPGLLCEDTPEALSRFLRQYVVSGILVEPDRLK